MKIVHEKKKYFKCNSCEKTFSQSGNLNNHFKKVHDGTKYNNCDSCGKAFFNAGKLKQHINAVHNGQKDHKCISCGKAFAEVGNMRKHIIGVKIAKKITIVILVERHFPHTSAEWYSIHKKNELAKPHINYESRTIV